MSPNPAASQIEGVIVENLPNTTFKVKLAGGEIMMCHLAGKMRLHYIRLLPGDRVRIETNPYDLARGRIIYKL